MTDRPPDETEIAELRRKLRETDARFGVERARMEQFTDCASDWWWEMDADLRYTFVSDRLFQVFGIRRRICC